MNREEIAEYIKENNARYDRLRQLDIESLDRAYRRFEKMKALRPLLNSTKEI